MVELGDIKRVVRDAGYKVIEVAGGEQAQSTPNRRRAAAKSPTNGAR